MTIKRQEKGNLNCNSGKIGLGLTLSMDNSISLRKNANNIISSKFLELKKNYI